MALQGNVESFGISEIFQLIAHQGKTGTLEIETGNGTARLRFLEGRLVEAWPEKRSPAELIGAILLRAGLITPTQLGHALELQRQSLRRLGDILIRIGALRIAEFREILALQHRETVFRLLSLKRGNFRFVSEPVEVEEGVSTALDLGGLLMEGFRQMDEWPGLKEVIPSEKMVYAQVEEGQAPADLTAEERRVLLLVDGTATVRQIVDRSRLGEFAAWEALAGLFRRGRIRSVGSVRRAKPAPRIARPRRVLDVVAAACLVAAAAGLYLFFSEITPPAPVRLGRAVEEARREAAVSARRAHARSTREPVHWPPLDR